ncbi:hypothetical protein NG829_18910 [Xanthomonas sacchari]|uniref:XAC0095 family protein n=1 Tax=Xanthomonas TaxID=338 RepID=UPI000689B104|nr:MULTISPECIES: hypothetical protein [Xanthomonas]MDY4341028.1 hypothetical protein [Xanthomonas sp. LF07-6]UYK80383.1 hypothetical protein NG829_18910 [Xanthomonas sacchari]
MPGYLLPEDSQFRLAKLRDQVRFLVRLAQPRTQAEERAAEPKVRMGELALCLELLADQVDLVLDALSYPAQRIDTTHGAWSDVTMDVKPSKESGAFRVTQEQVERFNLLVETVAFHATVKAFDSGSKGCGEISMGTGITLSDAVNEVFALLQQIKRQPLPASTPNGVREDRAAYGVQWGTLPSGSGWKH